MKIYTRDKLNKILGKHNLWLYSNGLKGERANLSKANLSLANLSKANLSKANLSYSDLREADLSEANLSYANLSLANLYKADLYKADLSYADLREADLSEADLSYANLSYSDLREADLKGANLYIIKGKEIITFQANKAFAYYCDGLIKISCKQLTVSEWLVNYKEIGKENNYSDREIELYGKFIKMIYEIHSQLK